MYFRNLKTGEIISSIELNISLETVGNICFSPTNWRFISVAYKNEINIWNIQECNKNHTKIIKRRFLLPELNKNGIESTEYHVENEYSYPNGAITCLDEEHEEIIEEILERKIRCRFKSLCWTNNEEIFIATKENYLLKV
jgi:WD40 repeat protein